MNALIHFCQMFIILLPPLPATDVQGPAPPTAVAGQSDGGDADEAIDPETMREAMKIREQLGIGILEGTSLENAGPPADDLRALDDGPIDYRRAAQKSILRQMDGIIGDLRAIRKHDAAEQVRGLQRELRREFGMSDD